MTTIANPIASREPISASILTAAREAHEARQRRLDAKAAAERALRESEERAKLEPFMATVNQRLGDLASRVTLRGKAASYGGRCDVWCEIDLGDAGHVCLTPYSTTGLNIAGYPWFNREHDDRPSTVADECACEHDDAAAAVLRVIHAVVTHPRPKPPAARPKLPPDGGAAYPCDATDGMTLRDRFAISALPAVYAEDTKTAQFADVARIAYAIADHMLTARDEPLMKLVTDDAGDADAAGLPPDDDDRYGIAMQ